MSTYEPWSEVHWHDLRKGDRVIVLERGCEVPSGMSEESFHHVEMTPAGSIAVHFKDDYSSSTRYDDPIDSKRRFFVRGHRR